jgi:uncharacterized BrkB/YihY/UPF0761 family membrane protein
MLGVAKAKDRARERWPAVDVLLATVERFGAIGGGALSANVGLAGFLSLFPLLLVAIAVAGFLSAGSPTFVDDVIDQLGLTGDAADAVTNAIRVAEDSRTVASIVGVVGLLWTGLAWWPRWAPPSTRRGKPREGACSTRCAAWHGWRAPARCSRARSRSRR